MSNEHAEPQIILNVDDFEPGRYARTRILERAGYTVIEASTGAAGLRLTRERRPDLILLDINLPDMSGLDVCSQIKADPDLSTISIVHISATAITNADWAQALDMGADGFLSEPVDPPVLIANVRAMLRAATSERELAKVNRELVRSNEDLASFAYVASHDLQEPLRTVVTYSQLLAKRFGNELGEEGGKYIDFMQDAAMRMSHLIRDLLLYSQAGTASQTAEVDLNQVFRRAVDNLHVSIEESGAVITSDPLPVLRADADQIARVLQNLIGNAIKYRANRPVVIHVSATRRGSRYVISVADNGSGFSPQYAKSIFEPFRRLDRDRSGTGIGLAIAKRLVESNGGHIWAESEVGVGATFLFALPGEAPAASAVGE